MTLKLDIVQKRVGRLRRSLTQLSKDPSPGAVHQLRSQISVLEAITPALMEDRAADVCGILRPLLQLRKAAGKVRDADVFADLIRLLSSGSDADCFAALSKYLRRRRKKTAARLHATIAKKQEDCQLCLKQYSKLVAKLVNSSEATVTKPPVPSPTALIQRLSAELSRWPRANRDDLHPYRIRVKKLRYLLQSTADGNPEFLKELTIVKDAIGEWHDWSELASVAVRTLEHGPSCPILKQIRLIARIKLRKAISLTNDMRRTYLARRMPKEMFADVGLQEPRHRALRTPIHDPDHLRARPLEQDFRSGANERSATGDTIGQGHHPLT
jgi:CHAD domain-containing protein